MKLKYMIYMSTALLTTGCNDAFLERAPQSLNDQTSGLPRMTSKRMPTVFTA